MSKYYLCEFHEQNGEFEYNHYHVYSDEFLNNHKIKITNEDNSNDVKFLNWFFGNVSEDDKDGEDTYWTYERLVSYKGFEEIEQSELKTLEKGGIYCD
jgi:restriction endonuclease S subunit